MKKYPINLIFVWPPCNPVYYNLCYNYSDLIEVASYFEDKVSNVRVIDGSASKNSNFEIISFLFKNKKNDNILCVYCHRGMISDTMKFCKWVKNIFPKVEIIVYGRLVKQIPKHFFVEYINAIVYDGDFEIAIESYIAYSQDFKNSKSFDKSNYLGIIIRNKNAWVKCKKGKYLEEWSFPKINLIPLEDYNTIYLKENTLSPIKNVKEITLTISRGCPVNCKFCDVPISQGLCDRRVKIKKVLSYLLYIQKTNMFDYVNFSSPFFSFDRSYCIDLCESIIRHKLSIKWKCVTKPDYLDKDLIYLMSKAGCKRIGIGVESLSLSVLKMLNKPILTESILDSIKYCQLYKIKLNCFIMLGIEGQKRKDIIDTISFLIKQGCSVRPTIYTPIYNMDAAKSSCELDEIDRRYVHYKVEKMSNEEIFDIAYNFDNWVKLNIR